MALKLSLSRIALRPRHKQIIKRFLLAEISVLALYILIGSVAYWAQVYRAFFLAKYIPYSIAQAIFIFAVQIGIIVYALLPWYREILAVPELSPDKLLEQGENEKLEFKSTLRWDIRAGKVNKTIEHAIMKTVAAFLNTDGGTLVLGVGDSKEVIGLAADYATLRKPDSDGWENHFSNIFQQMIGPELRQNVRLSWHQIGGKDCCVVSVMPSHRPAFLRADDREEFYIRTGNATTALKLSEATSYIKTRFA